MAAPLLEAFDFLYMPSRNVASDLAFYANVLGARVVFAIEAFNARVAEIRFTEGGPRLLLADHIHGETPTLVHRVADLDTALEELERRGLTVEARFGIPHGPCATFQTPGGQRFAAYQLTRPEADARFVGRLDFQPAPAPSP